MATTTNKQTCNREWSVMPLQHRTEREGGRERVRESEDDEEEEKLNIFLGCTYRDVHRGSQAQSFYSFLYQ